MKKIVLLVLAVSALLINPSYAGFLVKKHVAKTATENAVAAAGGTTLSAIQASSAVAAESRATSQKSSFFKRIIQKAAHPTDAIHPALYVICCVFWLGWLAMGINDDFKDHDWLICALLYLLFYFPGLIYSLIKMGKYY